MYSHLKCGTRGYHYRKRRGKTGKPRTASWGTVEGVTAIVTKSIQFNCPVLPVARGMSYWHHHHVDATQLLVHWYTDQEGKVDSSTPANWSISLEKNNLGSQRKRLKRRGSVRRCQYGLNCLKEGEKVEQSLHVERSFESKGESMKLLRRCLPSCVV